LARQRIVVAGGGMVAMKFATAMSDVDPAADVRVIGDEPAYDRTQLIHLLDDTRSRDAILRRRVATAGRIAAIDRVGKILRLVAAEGLAVRVPYDILIIATGAEPVRPDVPGIERALTFRRLEDVDRILALSPRNVMIVGGGTLGLEMADALSARGCAVTVVHAAERIMERHLDAATATALREALEAVGIRFLLGAKLSRVGPDFVDIAGVRVQADLVLLAVGVLPNDDLAKMAGLPCDRGVIVDDDMRTGDPSIFAIGDCVRHAGNSHCLLHQGYQHAHIAAKAIAGLDRWAPQASPAIILKTRYRAFVIGRTEGEPTEHRTSAGVRKLWLAKGRIVGAVILGPWEKIPMLRQAIENAEYFSLPHRMAFRCTGDPWPAQSPDPAHWPASAIVCQCNEVSLAAIKTSVRAGATTVDAIGRTCGAGTGCSGCRPLLSQILGEQPEAIAHQRTLIITAGAALVAALLLACGGIPFSPSFAWRWDVIWLDFTVKQISGYLLLATGVFLALTGLARRSESTPLVGKGAWRAVHAVAGGAAVAGLLLHSGGHMGQGIAFLLSVAWLGTLLAGGALGLVFARAHVMVSGVNLLAGKVAHWLHLFFLWPLPVLLAYHIAGAYLWH
jgi:nitrite reductase (NADH) large subunit